MTCANCFGDVALNRQQRSIVLLKIGELDDHDRYQCPRCHAKFWFPKDPTARQDRLPLKFVIR